MAIEENLANEDKEPKRLKEGKAFHKKIQKEWAKTAEGDVKAEKSVTKPNGRKGRADLFVKCDGALVAIVEIKTSNWDAMTLDAVRRNVKRQARQIWDYIESQLELKKEVSPGIIFPKRPKALNRLNLIEQLFDEEGIPVVWQDETISERKAREK